MLEFICSIPEEIGWAMVGYLTAWVHILGWKVGKTLYGMWKEWREPSIIFSDEPSTPEGEFRIGKEFVEN